MEKDINFEGVVNLDEESGISKMYEEVVNIEDNSINTNDQEAEVADEEACVEKVVVNQHLYQYVDCKVLICTLTCFI